jgi:ribosomal protein L37AE/L43A
MLEVEGVGNFEQPKCPQCQSLDVTYLLEKHAWTCDRCGNEWEAPGDATS